MKRVPLHYQEISSGGKFKDSVYGTFAECECETECDLSVGSLADVIDDIYGTLLKDANFEAGGNEWTKLGNPTIDKVVDGVGRDGGKALRIQSGFTWHGREQRNINVVAGNKYTLRAWWKIESLNSMVALPSHPAYLRIYYGKSNKYMPRYINEIPIPPTNINQWVEGRVDFVVPDDAAMISISMGGRGNGVSGTIQLLFDDISLIRTGSTKKSNAIKKYGPIYNWDMSLVTNMKNVFRGIATFNSDIR